MPIIKGKFGTTIINPIFTTDGKNSVRARLTGDDLKNWEILTSNDEKLFQRTTDQNMLETSYEFAVWFNSYPNIPPGVNKQLYDRNLEIATRTGCYKPELLGRYPHNFTPEGLFFRDWTANVINRLSLRSKAATGIAQIVDPTKAKFPHEIILYGYLPDYSIRMLGFLYDNVDEGILGKNTNLPIEDFASWKLETISSDDLEDGIKYVTMRSIRKNPFQLKKMERLIKFGLVDLTAIPHTGRGRPLTGISISRNGVKFINSWLDDNHPRFAEPSEMLYNVKMPEIPGIANPSRYEKDAADELSRETQEIYEKEEIYEKIDNSILPENYDNSILEQFSTEISDKSDMSDSRESTDDENVGISDTEIMRMKKELQQLSDGTLSEPRRRLPTRAELSDMLDMDEKRNKSSGSSRSIIDGENLEDLFGE